MKYIRYLPKLGDTFQISDNMSIRYEKIAEDLRPIWHEVPPSPGIGPIEEGTFIAVTHDIWFVYDHAQWRIMSQSEHTEASRQMWLNFSSEDGV